MSTAGGAPRASVITALVAVQIFFGLHYIAAKYIMTVIPPLAWATIRIVCASVLLMTFVLLTRPRRLPRSRRDLASIALFAVFGVMINQVCFVEGLSRTATSHSAIINCGIPVATLLFAILLGRERATRARLTGIILSLSGALYLIVHSGALLGGSFVAGDLLTMVNATSYSFFLVISKPILARHSSLAVTAELLLFGAIGISIFGMPQVAAIDPSAVPVSIWWAGAFVVIFATVGAYILSTWALKRVDSSMVALFIYLQPVVASVLSVVLLKETLGSETFISAALIFAGVAVALRSPAARKTVPA